MKNKFEDKCYVKQNEAVLWIESIFVGEYITYRVGRDGFTDAVTIGWTPEGNKGQSHGTIWRSSIPNRKDSECKCPEKETDSALRNRRETGGAQ